MELFERPADYFRYKAKGFNTEQGSPSVPTAESMRSMMAAEDVWPISDVWYYHDFHDGLKDYTQAIQTKYGQSGTLDEFCKKAQMVNYDSYRAMFESWNSKLWNNTSGLLLWMSHPAWPSTEWQTYSWDYETFGSYFGSLKACEPIHAQINLDDHKVVIVNTCLKELSDAKINYSLYNLKGQVLSNKQQKLDVKANRLTECFIPQLPASLPEVYLERVVLTDKKGRTVSINEYWKSTSDSGSFEKFNQLTMADLTGKILSQTSEKAGTFEFELVNKGSVPAIGIKLNLRDILTNKRILPAYFSDGYFTLLPGEHRRLTVSSNHIGEMVISVDGYNVSNQTILTIK